ncbi:MAG TPA: hypothetical protein VGL69_09135 [Solirubrobacteraceae bacterium]
MPREIKLAGPTIVAAALAAAYVIVSPPSLDLAAALFRAWLFHREPWGIWNNFWYSGHSTPGYSVLFPAVSAALTPQLAGGLAAALTAAPFTALAWRHRGPAALAGSLLFGVFTAVDLFTGRLPFAFGLLPATAAVLALDLRWWPLGCLLATVSALCSPVAALFAAIVALGYAVGGVLDSGFGGKGRRPRPYRPNRPWLDGRGRQASGALGAAAPGVAVAAGALLPILVLAVAFPEGGTEPFELGTLLPVLAVAVVGFALTERTDTTLRACLLVYALALILSYLIPSAIGSNVARMGTLLAAPVATVVFWERRPRLLAAAIVPLLYIGIQAPVQNVVVSSGQPTTSVAFYRPLLRFLQSRGGTPFRIEIPFTALHWEAYRVATRVPIARGWERQLDIRDNPIFYRRGALTAASYRTWLNANAVRFVALPDTKLDRSAQGEAAVIHARPAFLRPVAHVGAWRVYAVRDPTPIAQGAAQLTALGPDWLTLRARRAGRVLVHVRFSPYWALVDGTGCVEPAGPDTRLVLRRPGVARLAIRFSLGRIGAHSARCTR